MWHTTAQKFAQSSKQMRGWTKDVPSVSLEMLIAIEMFKI